MTNYYGKRNEIPTCEYSKNGVRLSSLVTKMIEDGKVQALYFKDQINYDVAIHEAVNDACIDLGLSDEEFNPTLSDKGLQVEIRLI